MLLLIIFRELMVVCKVWLGGVNNMVLFLWGCNRLCFVLSLFKCLDK